MRRCITEGKQFMDNQSPEGYDKQPIKDLAVEIQVKVEIKLGWCLKNKIHV